MAFAIREATVADIPHLARHRAGMFRDMGVLASDLEEELVRKTTESLQAAIPAGTYLAWVAESTGPDRSVIGGAGVQLRPILPRPGIGADGLELGPEAIVLNVYVDRAYRRRGVARALMESLLARLAERKIRRIVLHASPEGRQLYEDMGFRPTNEMQLLSPNPPAP